MLKQATTTSPNASNAMTIRARAERSPAGIARAPAMRCITWATILPPHLFAIELCCEVAHRLPRAWTEAEQIGAVHADDSAVLGCGRSRKCRVGQQFGVSDVEIFAAAHHQDDVGCRLHDRFVRDLLVTVIGLEHVVSSGHCDDAVSRRSTARGQDAAALYAENKEDALPGRTFSDQFLG